LAVVALAAFGPSLAYAASDMDQTAIVAEVNVELDGTGWMIGGIEITGTSRMERNDERLVVQEFTASARAMQTFYRQTQTADGYVFVDPVVQPGSRFDLRGEAVSFSGPGTSEQRVNLYNLRDMLSAGFALERFERDDRSVVILGTPEEAEARAAIAQAEAEAEAARQAEIARIAALYAGEWVSLGTCGRISFEHRFQIEPADEPGRFTGEVTYRPIYPTPPFEFGSYAFNARHDARRDRLVIEHSRWIERPQRNSAVTIALTLEADDSATLVGESSNILGFGARGNCSYRLQRPDAHEAEREAVRAPVRAFLDRLEPGVWVTGAQTGPERNEGSEWPVRVRVNSFTDDYIMATAELMAFHANSNRVLREMELGFVVFLIDGLEDAVLEFGRPPAVGARDVRNLYSRSNSCPEWAVSLDADSGLLTASHGDRRGCIAELQLPLRP
ncbi:MAG: hypothetical protein ACK4GT_14875, partial [Pararhodobacter sp.]